MLQTTRQEVSARHYPCTQAVEQPGLPWGKKQPVEVCTKLFSFLMPSLFLPAVKHHFIKLFSKEQLVQH